jgi:hypothetical protein
MLERVAKLDVEGAPLLESLEVVLHFLLEAPEHAPGELVVGARLAVLGHAESEAHAHEDHERLEHPVGHRLADFRDADF